MSAALDLTDVPTVCPSHLRMAMAIVALSGRAGSDFAGLDETALSRIEAALWNGGPPSAERTAVMLRLRALAAALADRRIAALFAAADTRTIAQALRAAATLRLNVHAGLNTTRLMWAMIERPAAVAVLPFRATPSTAPLPLAA